MELSKITININASVLEALKKLDALPRLLTLFVVQNNRVVGTLTDGDLRRGFIRGLTLNDSLEKFVFTQFQYLIEGEDNFSKLKKFRELKLIAVPLLTRNKELIKVYNFRETKSILPIDAVIMAGGKGSRLLPLTDKIPKPLLKVGNQEIISYNFKRLYQFGITNQKVTVNYLGEQIEEYCKNYPLDINFEIVRETEFLGTAGALSLIQNFENDIILLMNSDLLTNIDYEDFYQSFIVKKADMMVASVPYEVNLPYAILNSEDGRVSSFTEKPKHTYYANAGIYLIKKELLDAIPKGKFYNATDLMENVIETGKKLVHYPIRQYWLDIGKHADFEQAQKDVTHINW